MDEKVHIDKLNGTNYAQWKFKVKLFLIHKSCWNAVETTDDSEPSENDIQKALAIIGLSVADNQIVHIQDCKTAKEAWRNLSNVYEDAVTASKIVLQDKLMTTTLESGGSVQEHISSMRSIVSQLAAIGVEIKDEQYIIILLRSLPNDYDQLVVTLENINNLKIGDIHARLMREEARKNTNQTGMNTTTALQSNISNERKLSRNNKCFYCDKPGHRIK